MGPFDYPVPTHFPQANGFYCPNGRQPGQGWFLLTRKDVDDLDLNGTQTVFLADSLDRRRTFGTLYRLVITAQPVRVIGGQNDDPNGLYLVELSDQRWQCKNPHYSIPINKHYNVRAHGWPNGDFYDDSLNAGQAWTWEEMIEDVWLMMEAQIGAFPGLPITPNGTPEGWRFIGTSAWDALNDLLHRIGCQIAVNLFQSTNQFSIVQVGDSDDDTEKYLENAEKYGRKLQDRQFLDIYRGRTPYGVRVFFPRVDPRGTERTLAKETQWSVASVYSVDISGPATVTGYADADVYHPLHDDMVALYDASGNLLNSDELDERAQERADDFYRMLIDGGTLRALTYTGLVFAKIKGTFKAISWHQAADGGLVTDFIQHPWRDVRLGDRGSWETVAHLRPPDFGPTWPVYPHLEQLVNIYGTYGADPSGSVVYTAAVEHKDMDTGYWRRECECHVIDANDAELKTGRRYHARLNGSFGGKPLLITAEESIPAGAYYSGRQGRFCIDIEKQKCVDGVMVDDSISIQSDVPIWMSRTKCSNPTGQGGDGRPGYGDDPCPPGYVDTAACSNLDCQKQTFGVRPVGVTDGTCGSCNIWNQSFNLVYTNGCNWTSSDVGETDGCGSIKVELYYSGGYYYLSFSDGTNTIFYRTDGMSWNGDGGNVMSRMGVADPGWCNGWPDFLTVT